MIRTPVLVGMQAREALIECSVAPGVGPFKVSFQRPNSKRNEAAERETQVRVTAALAAIDVRVTGIATVSIPEGASTSELDLAIALACLQSVGRVQVPEGLYCRAELGLDGRLIPVRGTFPCLVSYQRASIAIVASDNAAEARAACNGGPLVLVNASLAVVAAALRKFDPVPFQLAKRDRSVPTSGITKLDTWAEHCSIVEQAAKQRQGILLLGRPGSGKTLLARHYHAWLPNLTPGEQVECMSIASAAGILGDKLHVPFRAPHHTVSEAGLLGGGHRLMPGEVTLATHGVLFLDELHEFRLAAIEGLKRALTAGTVDVGNNSCRVTYPARPAVVASAPKCQRDCRDACRCTSEETERHLERLSLLGLKMVTL